MFFGPPTRPLVRRPGGPQQSAQIGPTHGCSPWPLTVTYRDTCHAAQSHTLHGQPFPNGPGPPVPSGWPVSVGYGNAGTSGRPSISAGYVVPKTILGTPPAG